MSLARNDCMTCKVRNCSILKNCDSQTLTNISSYKLSGSIKKGERLFSEGDPVKGIYFIKKGFLKIELNGKVGRPLILSFVGKGTILGHRTNLAHAIHPSSATAASEVHYCYIPGHIFSEILCNSSILKQQILNQLLVDLKLTEKKALNLAHKSVREKIAEALLQIALVYGYEEKKQSFQINFCRQDIADLAGTTKEQVSKVLKELESEKLVKFTAKKFNYINIDALSAISLGNLSSPSTEK